MVSKTCKTSETNEQNKAPSEITDPVVVHTEVSCDDLVDVVDRICQVNCRMARKLMVLRMNRVPRMISMRTRRLISIGCVMSRMTFAMSVMVFRRIDPMSGMCNMVIRRTVSMLIAMSARVMGRIGLRITNREPMGISRAVQIELSENTVHFQVLEIFCRSVRKVRLTKLD